VAGELASSLAAKLDRLFRTFRRPDQGEYSYDQVARALASRGGPTISATYVWQLRTGRRTNPTKSHLEGLAEFFGVSPAYFFDEAAAGRIDGELELLAAMRDAQVTQIALRSFGLSRSSLEAIRSIIENARKLEGLPETGSSDGGAQPS
jgi:transcriptional regulator with XRE-family HTH domain